MAYRAQGGPPTSEHDRIGDAADDKGDTATAMTGGSARAGRFAVLVLLAVLPWTWFVLRDALGPVTDVVAIVLPTLVVVVAFVVVVAARFGRRWRAALVLATSTVLVGLLATLLPWVPRDAGRTEDHGAVRIAAANIGAGESSPATT